MAKIAGHARRQIEKRGILLEDIEEAVEHGEVIIEEMNHRFGLKKFSKLEGLASDLIVIWHWNKRDEKEVITAYWRRRR